MRICQLARSVLEARLYSPSGITPVPLLQSALVGLGGVFGSWAVRLKKVACACACSGGGGMVRSGAGWLEGRCINGEEGQTLCSLLP